MESKENSRRSAGTAAAELAKHREAVTRLAQSDDAKKLRELLQQQSGGVRQAAQQAAAGDPSALMAIMDQLIHSKEGAELVDRIGAQAKQAGLE